MSAKIQLSDRVQRIAASQTMSISALANQLRKEGKNIINFAVGEPHFDTPEPIRQAGIQAIQEGHLRYTDVAGIQALREAICRKFKRENKLDYAADQILVSCGAKHSLYNVFQSILNEGDEVIVPMPYWVSYPEMIVIAEGKMVAVPCQESLKISAEQLDNAITPRTRALILNSPNNPSGVIYSAEELKALAEVLLEHPKVLVVSDDIYEHITFKSEFHNILNVCPALYDQTILINGVSKSYAMTGWRIGYAAGPAHLVKAMKMLQSHSTSNPTTISQHAAIAALEQTEAFDAFIGMLRSTFEENCNLAYQVLQQIEGVEVCKPEGSFYIFPNFSGVIAQSSQFNDDLELCKYLLNEANIATVPGTAFGTPGYIRISYSIGKEALQEGLTRIQEAVHKAIS